ncbi:MAG: AAA family ATPase [Candidatus Diapherotrites archaeon]
MIKLKKLRLKNFKSFKDAKIPISDGFTVIVGANGTGKSNILDSIMFVLGITSMKALRASKIIDLVNKSSSENYAKVELTIKGDGRNYELARIIDKQGRSVYKLDDNKVTLSEITSLLRELGIKATGHNIVAQGDITRIIEMSPIERREIIDDMAGLREFDEKKAEALKELEKVDEKIKEVGIVLHERENYLAGLEKDKNATLEYENLENEKKMSKATLIYKEIEKIREKMETNERHLTAFKQTIEGKEDEKKNLKEQESKNKTRIYELNEKILRSNERAYTEIAKELEETKSAIRVTDERIKTKKSYLERNDLRQAELKEKTEKENNELEAQKNKMNETQKTLSELRERLIDAKTNLDIFDTEDISNEIKKLEKEVMELEESLDEKKQTYYEKGSVIPRIEESNREKKEMISELMKEKSVFERKINELENKKQLLNVVQMKHPSINEEIKKIENTYEKTFTEIKQHEAESNMHRDAIKELKKDISKCPTCERNLEKDVKKQILDKKEKLLKISDNSLEKAKKKKAEVEAKRKELNEALEKIRELDPEVEMLKSISHEKKSKDEKIEKLKSSLEEQLLEKEKEEYEKLKSKVVVLENEFNEKNDKLSEMKSGRINKRAGMEKEKDMLENEIAMLNERKDNIISKTIERISDDLKSHSKEIEELGKENEKLKNEITDENEKHKVLIEKSEKMDDELKDAQKANKKLIDDKNMLEQKNDSIVEKIIKVDQDIRKNEHQMNESKIDNSRNEVRLLDLEEEFAEFRGVKRFETFDADRLKSRIKEIEKIIIGLGAINMKALESFEELKKEVDDIKAKSKKLDEEKFSVLGMIEKIEVKRTNVFLDCFNEINGNFGRMFFSLFSGEGKLKLTNSEMPLESGLLIEAKHKTTLQNIDSMSGGEKTLTALAFLFAIQLYEPAPFYIFDEADAALDAENSVKLGNMIKEISKSSQFIAITHNDPLIKEADQIIGVALNEQKSSVIGLKLKEELQNNKFSE